jgi:hypothetical protein|tara:strand:+ start:3254 stop:3604 length:351 start_codon:yes stop_codon:yes gene_type:complete
MTKSETFITHITFRDRTYVKEAPITGDVELTDTITRLCEMPATSTIGNRVVGLEEALIEDDNHNLLVKIIGRDIILPSNLAARQQNFRCASDQERAAAIQEAIALTKGDSIVRLYV